MKRISLLLLTLILFVPLTACTTNKNPVPPEPQISENDTIVTMERDTEIQNLNRFTTFLSNQEKGIKDSIRIITLSPDGTTVPNDLSFDGTLFKLTITSKEPADPATKKLYSYTGTNVVKKEKGKYIQYDLKLRTEEENLIPLIIVPKETTSAKKS